MAIITNEIAVPKKLFGAKVDKELEFDSQIPEFCPDIARLIKVDCTPFAESCEIDDSKAVVKGKAVYDVLYETDYKSRLRCCSFTQEFTQSIPLPRTNTENTSAFCKVGCERINCKLLSPRRLVIKATLGTALEAEGSTPVKVVAVSEDKDTFFCNKTLTYEGESVHFTETYRFGDSFPLTQSEKAIGETVCGNIYLQQPQLTLSEGHAEIKSVASVHVLCEEESNEGRYYVSVKTLPINIDYANELIDSEKHISVMLDVVSPEFSHELDQYGESRVIKADFSVRMQMKLNSQEEFSVADDVFEKEFDGTPVVSSAILPKLFSVSDIGFSEEDKIDPLMPSAVNILDTSVKCRSGSVGTNEEGVTASGSFIVTMIYESEDGIHSIDKSIPFDRSFPCELPDHGVAVSAETYPIEIQSSLHPDGSVSLRVVASTRVSIFSETEESFVSDVIKRTPCKRPTEDCTLVYCFPKEGEPLWEIAKHYKVSPKSILDANRSLFDENEKAVGSEGPILIKG